MPPRPTASTGLEAGALSPGKVAEEGLPEGEVLLHRQFALHRVAVAEIVRRLAEALDRVRCSKEFRRPRFGRQQPGQDPQQRRLAGAVRPLDDEGFAAGNFEGNILENQIFAASGTQSLGDEPHGVHFLFTTLVAMQKIVPICRPALWNVS